MSWDRFGAGDAFAITMLGVIALSFGTVLALLYSMLRHSGRRDPEVDRLIEETRRKQEEDQEADASAKPWEKKADWWR